MAQGKQSKAGCAVSPCLWECFTYQKVHDDVLLPSMWNAHFVSYAVMLSDKQCARRGEGEADSLVPVHNVSGATQGVTTYTVRNTGVATLQQLSVTLYVMT